MNRIKKRKRISYANLRDELESKILRGEALSKQEIELYAKYCCHAPDLFHQYLDAKETLFNLVVPYVKSLSYKYYAKYPSISFNDFMQEAMTEVWAKIENFVWCKRPRNYEEEIEFEEDENKEVSIFTYVSYIIQDSLQGCIAKNSHVYLGNTNLKLRAKIKDMTSRGIPKEEICKILKIRMDRLEGILKMDTVSSLHKTVSGSDSDEIEMLEIIPDQNSNKIEINMCLRLLYELFSKADLSEFEKEAVMIKFNFKKNFEKLDNSKLSYYSKRGVSKLQNLKEEDLSLLHECLTKLMDKRS